MLFRLSCERFIDFAPVTFKSCSWLLLNDISLLIDRLGVIFRLLHFLLPCISFFDNYL